MKDVKYIKYGDEKLPLRFSYKAMKWYQLETGEDGLNENSTPDKIELYYYYGFKAGFDAIGKEFNIKLEDMEDILDEVLPELTKLMESFFLSQDKKSKVK